MWLDEIRQKVSLLPGTNVTVGQPISHRIDHMLSGTRANIAVKIFGDDLQQLRALGQQVQAEMALVPGVVDLSAEAQADIPTLRVNVDSAAASRYGLVTGAVTEALQTARIGQQVGQVLEGQIAFPLCTAPRNVVPILMTALAAGFALVPIALSAGQPGSEIQAPMAMVIMFGLLSSTALNMIVVPILYDRPLAARRCPPSVVRYPVRPTTGAHPMTVTFVRVLRLGLVAMGLGVSGWSALGCSGAPAPAIPAAQKAPTRPGTVTRTR